MLAPRLITALVLLAVGFGGGWYFQGLRWDADIADKERQHNLEIGTARTEEQDKCRKRQKITKETSNAYWKHIDDLERVHAAAIKRVRADTTKQCVPITGTTSGNNATDRISNAVGAHAVAAEPLINIAATGDRHAATLTACQDFIRRTWEVNGQ